MFGKPDDKKKMDLDSLDELISKCEDSMVSPFKKKKEAVSIEMDPEDIADGGKDEGAEGKPDLSDMDMEDLMKLYQEIKDRK